MVGGIVVVLLAGLTAYLRDDVQVWAVVMQVPGTDDGEDMEGWFGRGHAVAIDRDRRRMAISRPDGIEVWDLNAREHLVTLRSRALLDPTREYGPAVWLSWFDEGRRLLYRDSGGYRWHVYDLETHEELELPMSGGARAAAASPDGHRIAYATLTSVVIYDLSADDVVWYWDLERVNGGFRRMEWSADGRRLLLADRIGLYVWDLQADELVFHHRELDMRLPSPMLADEDSGYEDPQDLRTAGGRPHFSSRFAHVAEIADARFTPDGQHILCAYAPPGVSFRGNPEASRVRLYSATGGRLIEDQPLPAPPRITLVTPDRRTLLIVCRADGDLSAEVVAFNIDGLHRRYAHRFDLSHYFPASIASDRAGRFLVFAASKTWVADLREVYPPTRLPIDGNAHMVAAFNDGRRVLQADADGAVTLLERQAQLMRHGPWSRPAIWLLYAVGVGGVIAITIVGGVRRGQLDNRRVPPALWIASLLIAITFGQNIAATLADWAIEPVFTASSDRVGIPLLGLASDLFFIVALFGTINLRWGWRLILLIAHWLGLIASVSFVIVLAHLAATDRLEPPSLDSTFSTAGYRDTLHGLPIEIPLWGVFVAAGVSIVISAIILRLLHHPTVRARLRGTARGRARWSRDLPGGSGSRPAAGF